MMNISFRTKIWSISLGLIFFGTTIYAQDIHFSQFHNGQLNLNPGLTGIFPGEQRFSAIYRQQWAAVPVPYTTISGAYDMRFPSHRSSNGFFSGGLLFNYDKAGDSKLSLVNLTGLGSYSLVVKDKHIFTFGLGAGVDQRRFNEDELRWDRQWNGDAYDPSSSSDEVFQATDIFYFDLSAGLNYRFQKNKRTWLNIGAGGFHLTQPDQSYYALDRDDTKLDYRLSATILTSFKLADQFDLLVNGLAQFQGEYQEMVASVLARIYLKNEPGNHLMLDLGAGYRLDDAFYPIIGLQWENWNVGLSYDINTSFFDIATDGKGGPEVTVTYIFADAKLPGQFKKCPVY